jgi:hypothetical protein
MFHAYRKTLLIIGIVLCLFSSVFAYSGGLGTAINPYQISNVPDWNSLMSTPSDWDKNFIMTADVNLHGIALTPVGTVSINFTGVFDGNSHIIRNADTNSPNLNYIGLFGYIGTGSRVRNLGVENVRTIGNNYVGGLAGYNKGIITACRAEGTVSGSNYYIGGLIGFNYQGSVSDCCAAGIVSGNSDVGGLVGRNYNGSISDCCAASSVDGNESGDDVGGLVGSNYEGSNISNCHAAGQVSGGYYVGGLAGFNYGNTIITNCYARGASSGDNSVGGLIGYNNFNTRVSNCYATGQASGNNNIGGLVGHNYYYSSTITNCYAQGRVGGHNNVGGLVGDNWNTITDCYARGPVTGDSNVSTGGFLGHSGGEGTVIASFWDVNTSGWSTSAGGTGKTTAEMKTRSIFTTAGWDFNTPVWKICDGTNYPKLAWQKPLTGDFVCPDGVGLEDLLVFCEQWLLEKLSFDTNNDGIVNFLDFAVFANSWHGNMNQLSQFASQWLKPSAYNADIAPAPAGDGIVNMLDFAAFANNWLEGT